MQKTIKGTLVYTSEDIHNRATELAKEIIRETETIDILICVLDGGYPWTNIMHKKLPVLTRHDVNISFYDENPESLVTDNKIDEIDCTNKTILVCDDIANTGTTLAYIVNKLQQKTPKKIEACVLGTRYAKRKDEHKWLDRTVLKYVAFDLKDDFYFGCGMCWKTMPTSTRELPDLYKLDEWPKDFETLTKKGI